MQREACPHTPGQQLLSVGQHSGSFSTTAPEESTSITSPSAVHGCNRLTYKILNTRPKFHSLPFKVLGWKTAADVGPSMFPHSLYSPSMPLSQHICLSDLRVKDREGQEDMQRTALHQSGDRASLCQLNGMCLCRKSQTHVPFSPPTLWLLNLFSTTYCSVIILIT